MTLDLGETPDIRATTSAHAGAQADHVPRTLHEKAGQGTCLPLIQPVPVKGGQMPPPWQESNEWQEPTQPKLLMKSLSSQVSAPLDANGAHGQPSLEKAIPTVTSKLPARPSRPLVSEFEAKLTLKAKSFDRKPCSCFFFWSCDRYAWRGGGEL